MKKTIKFLAIAVTVLGFSNGAFAQGSASTTANVSANIITPIAIAKISDMNYANVAPGTSIGTVVMDHTSAGGRTATGGVTLPTTTGTTPAAASFGITGESGLNYTVTIPSGTTTLSDGVSHTMTVDTWQMNLSPTTNTMTAGTTTLYVGATLHVGISQARGTYTATASGGSGAFSVTVSY